MSSLFDKIMSGVTGKAGEIAGSIAGQPAPTQQPAATKTAKQEPAAQPMWFQQLLQNTQPAPVTMPQQPAVPVQEPIVQNAYSAPRAAAPSEPEEEAAETKKTSFNQGDGKNRKSNYEQYLENVVASQQAEEQPANPSDMSFGDMMMARSLANLSGDEDLANSYDEAISENVGAAAGIANPVGAAKGLLSAMRTAKADKLLAKATKLEEKANKGKKAAKAAEPAKEAAKETEAVAKEAAEAAGKEKLAGSNLGPDAATVKAAENELKAAEDLDDIAAARAARYVMDRPARREAMLEGLGKTAQTAAKVTKPKDLIAPGAAVGGMLAAMIGAGILDPDAAGRPGGEGIANQIDEIMKETGWDTGAIGEDNGSGSGGDILGPMPPGMNEAVMAYNMPLSEYTALTQRQQYNKALEDQALRDYYAQTYADQDQWGDLLGELGYEAFRDIGDRGDYSYKHDLVRDLFGYNRNAEGNAQYGIVGWNDMARGAIPGLAEMSDEDAIQAIMNYMWAPENIIDPYRYATDEAYAKSKNLGDLDSADYLGQYFGNNYIGNGITDNFLGSLVDEEGNPLYNLDNYDLGLMFMTANLMNQGIGGNFDESDLALMNELLGLGGDNATFSFAGDDEEGFDWNYDPKRRYQVAAMLNQLKDQQMDIAANGGRGDQYALNVYSGEGVDSDLIDANMADDLMGYLEAQTGRKISRS